jgi:hypothetical protein
MIDDYKQLKSKYIEKRVYFVYNGDIYSNFNDERIKTMTESIYKHYIEAKKESTDNIKAYNKKLETINNKIANLVEAISDGKAYDALLKKVGELERQKEILDHEIKLEQFTLGTFVTKEIIKDYLDMGKDISHKTEHEKTVTINNYIDKITVSSAGEVHITYIVDMVTYHGGEAWRFTTMSTIAS